MRNIILLILLSVYTFKARTQTLQSVTDNGNTTSNNININTGNEGVSLLGRSYLSFKNPGSLSRMGYIQHNGENLVISSDIGNINFTNNVGIGIINPSYKLDVSGEARIATTIVTNSNAPFSNSSILFSTPGFHNMFGVDGTWSSKYFGMKTDGTFVSMGGNFGIGTDSPTDKFHLLGGFNLTNPSANSQFLKLYISGAVGFIDGGQGNLSMVYKGVQHIWRNPSEDESMRIDPGGNVGIGTPDPRGYKLAVNGNIRAREIKVEASPWPDYVFTKDYELPTLQQTEKHIKEKGHLSGIPSAKEVEAEGINLGEMNAKLLQKIEELTLHLIEQNKAIESLTNQNKKHQEDIQFLKSRVK